ncbi:MULTISPECIES: phosphoribosylamine--glycine ligase [unclassified Luteococcus]|uniref:phosphoribosylamine--glycine ligase n=1 Tax=unclassified Luteococcus TaxID=2639923 RepID=UPI00313D4C30
MTDTLTVLVVGSGGREHALALAISKDPAVSAVHVAPGNPGTASFATNHPVDQNDGAAVAGLAQELGADLVVVGPEAPLVAGVADAVREAGIACFGPSRAAAQLEGSKAFAKEVMAAAGVPTAAARVCVTQEEIEAALDEFGATYVVKDDGLAAGKGVVVTDDRDEALQHALACERVVIEEFLDGPEVSLFAICDGTTSRPMQPAQDFKRVGDDDQGPNTGGMGAYTPLPWAPADIVEQVDRLVIQPTLAEMERRGAPFTGLLYAGLALTSKGIRVVEFNVRFGDPETQALLARLKTPLGQLLHAAATGVLAQTPALEWGSGAAVVVVMAANGYPASAEVGGQIILAPDTETAHTIQAGTAELDDGTLVANGGRVLGVVGAGDDLTAARQAAYAQVAATDFASGFNRTDIALKASQNKINHTAPTTEN